MFTKLTSMNIFRRQKEPRKRELSSLTVTPLDVPPPDDVVRFVCLSDTHNYSELLPFTVPDGDVLIHAGDFTMAGTMAEVMKFNDWLGTMPHRTKVVIAGNHERILDSGMSRDDHDPARILSNCTYLQDAATTVCGIHIYGSPWTPEYHSMAFNLPRGDPIRRRWAAIPTDTDVLVTHGPPLGHGDLTPHNGRVGCEDLLHVIQDKVKPKFHIFGHIHEAYGVTTDGTTTFINAATCDIMYDATNVPVVFDLAVPDGRTKAQWFGE